MCHSPDSGSVPHSCYLITTHRVQWNTPQWYGHLTRSLCDSWCWNGEKTAHRFLKHPFFLSLPGLLCSCGRVQDTPISLFSSTFYPPWEDSFLPTLAEGFSYSGFNICPWLWSRGALYWTEFPLCFNPPQLPHCPLWDLPFSHWTSGLWDDWIFGEKI